MPRKAKTPDEECERLCPWCEERFQSASDYICTVCPDCRADLMDQPKEVLIQMLGGATGVNMVVMTALRIHAPDLIDELALLTAPGEAFCRRPAKVKALTRKDRRVQ